MSMKLKHQQGTIINNEALLINIITNYSRQSYQNISKSNLNSFQIMVKDFIRKKISLEEAYEKSCEYAGSSKPIEELELIMKSENEKPIDITDKSISFIQNPTNGQKISKKKGRSWTKNEDRRLIYGVYKFGIGSWSKIANFVGAGRNRSTCSQRWFRVLSPDIEKGGWTQEEEITLLWLCLIHGTQNWSKISHLLRKRSDVQCRYHYSQMIKTGRINQLLMQLQKNTQMMSIQNRAMLLQFIPVHGKLGIASSHELQKWGNMTSKAITTEKNKEKASSDVFLNSNVSQNSIDLSFADELTKDKQNEIHVNIDDTNVNREYKLNNNENIDLSSIFDKDSILFNEWENEFSDLLEQIND